MPRNPKSKVVKIDSAGIHAGAPEATLVASAPAPDPSPSPRIGGELLPNVIANRSTLTGISDAEAKNYLATADFACRQLAIQLAEMWKDICKVAAKNGQDDVKAARVGLSVKIDIDHTNLLLHDTKVTTSYSEKHSQTSEIQEDLSQTVFSLEPA